MFFATSVFAAEWIYAGEIDTGENVWMSTDIKTVGYIDKNGKQKILDGIFNSQYKITIGNDDSKSVLFANFYDLKAQKSFMISPPSQAWEGDEAGGDGFLYGAYIISHYFEILAKNPLILKDKYVPLDRKPIFQVDKNGWIQAYKNKDGSEAWVQTKSARLSSFSGEDLPKVKILVRRSDIIDGKKTVTYAYEIYDPLIRTKKVLKSWDAVGKEIRVVQGNVMKVMFISKDSIIATQGYYVFLWDYAKVSQKTLFVDDDVLFIPKNWFAFEEKK